MNSNRRVAYPKSSTDYGTYAWHYAWSVDIACRAITHTSGLVFDFQPRDNTLRPPFGGACPASAWSGELRGGAASVPIDMKEHVAERLCLEALQFSPTWLGSRAWTVRRTPRAATITWSTKSCGSRFIRATSECFAFHVLRVACDVACE